MSDLINDLNSILGPNKPLRIDPDKSCILKKPPPYPSMEEIYLFLTKAVQYKLPVTTKEWKLLVEQISYLRTFQQLELLKLTNKTGLRQIKKCVMSRTLTTQDMVLQECKHMTIDRRYHIRWKKWMALICIHEAKFHKLNKKHQVNEMQVDINVQTSYNAHTTNPKVLAESLGESHPFTISRPSYNDVHIELPYTPLPYMLHKREIKKVASWPHIQVISTTLFGQPIEEEFTVDDVEDTHEWTTEEDDALLDIMDSLLYTHYLRNHYSIWPCVSAIHNTQFNRPSDFMGKQRTQKEVQKRYILLTDQRPSTNPLNIKSKVSKLMTLINQNLSKKPKPIQPTKKQPLLVDKLDFPAQTPLEIANSRFNGEDQEPNSGSNQFYQYLNRPLTQQQVQKRSSSQNSQYANNNQPLQNRTAVEQWQSFLAQRQYLQSYAQQRRPEEEEEKKKRKRKSSTVTLKQQQQEENDPQLAPPPSQSTPQQVTQQLESPQLGQNAVPVQSGQPQIPAQHGYSNITNMQWMAHLQRQRYRQFAARPAGGLDIQHQAALYSYSQRPQYMGQMGQYTQQQPVNTVSAIPPSAQQAPPVPVQKPQKKRKKAKKEP
eukprot:NODE_4_length_55019_cov_0.425091.p5 type:complete len:600 gc:universal NODE_4_length_55019_cov_0.425091:15358-17157(+)